MALTVREVMDADPAFVYAGDRTERVLEVLRVHELPGVADRKHNRLPVIAHGRLVGVVTRLDVLEPLTRA